MTGVIGTSALGTAASGKPPYLVRGAKVNAGERTALVSDSSPSGAALPVFIVDPDAKAREHLTALVRASGWQPRAFGSAEELLADPRSRMPACIVMDVDLPGLSGLELQRRLIGRTGVSVVFASACRDVRLTVRAMKAGAVNYLTKPVDGKALANTITEALERSRKSLHREAEQHVLRGRFARLSARERQVMDLVIGGRLNKEVAAELGISPVTVKVHRGRVMRKMRARSLAELVRLGARLGLGSEGRSVSVTRDRVRTAADTALRGGRPLNTATTIFAA